MSFREEKEKPKTQRDFGFFIRILGKWLLLRPITRAEFSMITVKSKQNILNSEQRSGLNQNKVTTNFSKKCQVAIVKHFEIKFFQRTLGQV